MEHQVDVSLKRPRIGLLYLGSRGGICYYTFELARSLAAHADVILYVASHNAILEQFQELPVTVRIFDTYRGMGSLLASIITQDGPRRVAEVIDGDRPAILLDTGAGPWAEMVKRHMETRPLLADVIHDVKFHPDRWNMLLRLQHFFYPRRSDAYIALSRYSFNELVRLYPDAGHIESVHGVITPPDHLPNPAEISGRRHRLLFLGRLEAYKGLSMLVEAFAIAQRQNPSLTLTVAGQGPLSSKLKKRMASLGVRLIHTWLSEAMMHDLLSSHGQVILPYRSASQSGVVATALAYGLPCVGTAVGGLQEQIAHEKTGLLVPPESPHALAEAVLKLAAEPNLVESMAIASRHSAQTDYEWIRIGRRLLQELEALR